MSSSRIAYQKIETDCAVVIIPPPPRPLNYQSVSQLADRWQQKRVLYKSGKDEHLHAIRKPTSDGANSTEGNCELVGTPATHYIAQTTIQRRKCACREEVPNRNVSKKPRHLCRPSLRCPEPTSLVGLIKVGGYRWKHYLSKLISETEFDKGTPAYWLEPTSLGELWTL
jgi:hypothetical protein